VRLYSTPQSALAGEVTVLAIIETIAATAFSVWLVVHRGTLTHVVIGACVAPFLLLRTEESTIRALRWAEYLRELNYALPRVADLGNKLIGLALLLLKLGMLTLGIALIRPLSLAVTALLHPIISIRAIPENWNRVVLATDFLHAPEILPEAETRDSALLSESAFRFSAMLSLLRKQSTQRDSGWIARTVLVLLVGGFWYVPSLLYRYSLKATALIYLPIIWVLHDSVVGEANFQYKLADIKESQIERLKRWYSGFVLVFLVIVPAIVYATEQEWWRKMAILMQRIHPALIALLSAFLPTMRTGLEIRGWHLARGINATLTVLLFFWADGKLRQIGRGTFKKTDAAVAKLNLWLLARGLLTLYIIGCTLYIVAAAVNWRSLWPVHIKWFP
jgi:hypothetical protein